MNAVHSEDRDECNDEEDDEFEDNTRSRKRARTSTIWRDFKLLKSGRKRCDHCGKYYGKKTGSGSLKYHLQAEHSGRAAALGNAGFDPRHADQLVANVVAYNYLSFQLVDDHFRVLMAYCSGGYAPPSRRKLVDTVIPEIRCGLEKVIQQKLASISSVALAFDGWTSTANRGYIAVTAHGITKCWILETFLLSVIPVTENETGEFLGRAVTEVLEMWEIHKDRVIAITSDGASNVRNAAQKRLGFSWFYCLAHVINRSVRKALDHRSVSELMHKAKAICKFFRMSHKSMRALMERRQLLGLTSKKYALTIDNETRWGSAFKMMKRMCYMREAISATLAGLSDTNAPDNLTTAQWSLLKRIKQILHSVHEASEFVSQQNHPTVGICMPIMYELIHQHLSGGEELEKEISEEDAVVNAFRDALLDDLKKRWTGITDDSADTLLLAVYLDPRFKDFAFIPDEEQRNAFVLHASRAAEDAARTMSFTTLGEMVCPTAMSEAGPINPVVPRNYNKMHRLFGPRTMGATTNAIENALDEELRDYQREPPCALLDTLHPSGAPTDILLWWKTHQAKFPRLSQLARNFLCINATSVPCERVFSRGGYIVHKRRCSLSDKNVSELMFIACNQHHDETAVVTNKGIGAKHK